MATIVAGTVRAERFWQKLAIGLAIFIVFGFLQFALRGFVDPVRAPWWVHLHGVAMLSWLALLIAQPTLVLQGNLALHRRLGRIGAGLALFIAGLAIFTGVASLMLHRFPPFFTPPYFLVLCVVEAVVFIAMVGWGISLRRTTDWHQRVMIGATVIILEPALGRILPMPFMIGWSDLPVGFCQLVVVGIIALHDRRTLGAVHPATKIIAAIVVADRATIYFLSMAPPVIALAERLAGS